MAKSSKDALVRTALHFKKAEYERVKLLSRNTGIPAAELIRRAVSHYLELRKAELAKDFKPL